VLSVEKISPVLWQNFGFCWGKRGEYYTVSEKNVPHLACDNFEAREWILTFFGRNVTDKVGNQ